VSHKTYYQNNADKFKKHPSKHENHAEWFKSAFTQAYKSNPNKFKEVFKKFYAKNAE